MTMTNLPALRLGRDVLADYEGAIGREWLVTNGLGGYAAGSIAGPNTRRYHGLLVASLRPPVERTVMVAALELAVRVDGRRIALSAHEFGGGHRHPDGWRHLTEFRLEGTLPVWRWTLGAVVFEQRLWMPHGTNTTCVQWTLVSAPSPVELEVAPLCTYRDYHWHHRGPYGFNVRTEARAATLTAYAGARPFRLQSERATFDSAPDTYWNFHHREEAGRGLDDGEDLFRPGAFRVTLQPGESETLTLTAEHDAPRPAAATRVVELERQRELLGRAGLPPSAPEWIRQLVLAADQFVVERRTADGQPLGHTVIAGYPWFADWGRDTMIALPGLALATGRHEIAASVLRTFARFVSEGMLPNRFPDAGDAPEYNTVDATLWYFVAVGEYWRRTQDRTLVAELYPVLQDIVAWHERGTRYGIAVDPEDGLLRAGVDGVQLTWMDAKVGDWVVTPRIGKPVEINALWHDALATLRDLALVLDRKDDAARWLAAAERVARSFNDRFWNANDRCLYDVIDGPEGGIGADGRRRDGSLRPNQVFAVSLPHALLDTERARAVLDACHRALWTPIGLRSLDPADRAYTATYRGGPLQRDAAYHEGTVWSWVAGPFALAHHRAHGDAAHARALLDGMADHLREACLGQVSEILEGDSPHLPRGCFAQAWGVAETLRAWRELDECEAQERRRGHSHRSPRQVAT
jgi:predicted glycogen debranching enzyme